MGGGKSNAISYISNFQKNFVIVVVACVASVSVEQRAKKERRTGVSAFCSTETLATQAILVVVVTLESPLLTRVVPILSSIDSAMMTPQAPPPSVIYYHFVLHRAANKTCSHALLLNCFLHHTKPYQIKHR